MPYRPGGNGRLSRRVADVRLFVHRYGRKTQKGGRDPNDRSYDRDVEAAVKQMDPERLDDLLFDREAP